MIIESIVEITENDVEAYAWRRLSQYTNIEHIKNLICQLHEVSKKHEKNARSQAEQIRFCLIQAKEYFEASKTVSLSTKPVLLYYCTMSFALAEILLKQTGSSRLSKLRQEHNCHGLSLNVGSVPDINDTLKSAASKLISKVQEDKNGEPKGTFEIWRRSAREYPLPGLFTQISGKSKTVANRMLFTPSDIPPPTISNAGISLYDCIVNLPYLSHTLNSWGCNLNMVRASISCEANMDKKEFANKLIIHPVSAELFQRFGDLCKIHPAYVNYLNVIEVPAGGCIMTWKHNGDVMSLPHSICLNNKEAWFTCSSENIGEFGYLYVAFHILGNFARYYPDYWMRHVETNSSLANIADDLCANAFKRLPLISLSELSRSYHVIHN